MVRLPCPIITCKAGIRRALTPSWVSHKPCFFRRNHAGAQASAKFDSADCIYDSYKDLENRHFQGFPLSRDQTYRLICNRAEKKVSITGAQLHVLMVSSGLDTVLALTDRLICLFASCGSLLEANLVFCTVAEPTIYTWHAIISAHARLGCERRALELYHQMQDTGVQPNQLTFLCVLRTCGSIRAISQGMMVHTCITISGFETVGIMGNSLVDMYAKCGYVDEADMIFKAMPARDVASWNTMITGYSQHGCHSVALKLYEKMQEKGLNPDKITFACVLNICGSLGAIELGKVLHQHLLIRGFEVDTVVANTLIDMYAKCGSLNEAQYIFNKLPDQDLISWSAMIAGYVQHDYGASALDLFLSMLQEQLTPDRITYVSSLKACGSLGVVVQGMLIHDMIVHGVLEVDVVLGSTLIDMYGKCGNIVEAHKVFDDLPSKNLVSWNALISGCVQHGHDYQTLELFNRMLLDDVWPDSVTFLCALKASGSIGSKEIGKLLHMQMITVGLHSDGSVGCSLIDMYGKFGYLEDALKVCENSPGHESELWNALIASYAQNRHVLMALELMEKMQEEGAMPNEVTWSCLFKACATTGAIGEGRLAHDQMLRMGVKLDVVLGNTLIDMYIKLGSLEAAFQVFEKLLNRNLVSWNAMIAGCVSYGLGFPAIGLFERLHAEGLTPDKATLLSSLKASSIVVAIKQGKMMHDQIIRDGLEKDVVISSALIDMYIRCGSLDCAHVLFQKLPNHNVVSWGSMIAGFAFHGHCELAEEYLHHMQQQGLKPDSQMYTNILAACSHAGLVEKGYQYFKSMIEEHGLEPTIEQFTCMVDLLGRSGQLCEAKGLLQSLPSTPDISTWMSLFTACRVYGVGSYVKLFIKDVPLKSAASLENSYKQMLLVACGLFQHESKMSVLHFSIKKHETFLEPLKSKKHLFFIQDFVYTRQIHFFPLTTLTWTNISLKGFFIQDVFSVASVFAPISFPPLSLIVFKENIQATENALFVAS